MPSGGTQPLSGKDWDIVRDAYDAAVKEGLQYEWLQWFAGGLWLDKVPPRESAIAACLEWDF